MNVLGVHPILGRTFKRDEEKAGGRPSGFSVVLSHAFWQEHFKSDRSVVGKLVKLDGRPFTVIGIMPADFSFPIDADPAEVFITIALDASSADGTKPESEQRGSHSLRGIGRLKSGATVALADVELRTIAATLARQYPDSNTKFSAGATPLREDLVGDVARGLYVLFGAVGCVLLIASANVANLLLARATVRQKEIALRSALGASRARIIRQLLAESVLLAAIGGFCGLILALWGPISGLVSSGKHSARERDPSRRRRSRLHLSGLTGHGRSLWPRARFAKFTARSAERAERQFAWLE